MNVPSMFSVSFESVFGNTPDDISLEKVQSFLEEVVGKTCQLTNHDANNLIRVVEDGGIHWMTVEQAKSILERPQEDRDQRLQEGVHNALRSESNVIAQELRVLVLLANGTIQKYRAANAVALDDLDRSEFQLARIHRTVQSQLEKLQETEKRIKEARRRNPILDEFENKMGRLLNMQRQGENDQAITLAKELAALKKKYVIIGKVLANDTNLSYRLRLDLQRQKIVILSSQRYLIAQREGALKEELQDLRKAIDNVKTIMKKETGEGLEKYSQYLTEKEGKVEKNEKELVVVQQEQKVLKAKEEETEALVQQMAKAIDDDAVEELEEAVQTEQPKQEDEPAPETGTEEQKKNIQRMARSARRED